MLNAVRIPLASNKSQVTTYSSCQVASDLGCTLRELQLWDEAQLLGHVPIIRHSRQWDDSAKLRASIIVSLRRRGLSLQRVRKVLRIISRVMPGPDERPFYIIVDGRGNAAVCLHQSEAFCRALKMSARGAVTIACIGEELK